MKIELLPIRLKLKYPFKTAQVARTHQDNLVIRISHNNISGYGEATTNEYFGTSIDQLSKEITEGWDKLNVDQIIDPATFYKDIQSVVPSNFARCALDQAYLDLYNKLENQTTMRYFGIPQNSIPPTDLTIGLAPLSQMIQKMKDQPWPIYKIKASSDLTLEDIQQLNNSTTSQLRIDANCGWEATDLVASLPKLAEMGIELLEQPLPRSQWDVMQEIYANSPIPLIADESCVDISDIDRCKGHFHGVNIKLTKCGGMTPAFQMIRHAKRLNMKVMIGCMTESSVGISAAAQLIPFVDYVDIDGSLLIAEDYARGVRFESGRVVYPQGIMGNGVEWI